VGIHDGANSSGAEGIAYDVNTVHDYDNSMLSNMVPSINADVVMNDLQRLSGPNAWELELLGEDSLWANLPILSNFMSVQESETYGYVFFHKFR
jgi:hypothetical protein